MDPWAAAAVLVTALTYAATLGAAGASGFLAYSWGLLAPEDRRAIRRWAALLGVAGCVIGALRLGVAAAWMDGSGAGLTDPSLWRLAAQSGEGAALGLRGVALVLLSAALLRDRRPGALALLGAAGAAGSFALTGHVHRTASALPAGLLWVHLLGVACWVGALVPLLLIARRGEPARIAPPARRFGVLAVPVVGALIAAGVLVLASLLESPAELWSSDYGRLVLLKLGAVAGLLACAALNKLSLTPRLCAGDARAVRALRISIGLEIVLALGILVLTAAFTTLTGPPSLE